MDPRKLLLILTLVIMLVLCAIIWFYPSTGDFRVDNPFWNGLSEFSGYENIRVLDSFADLPSPGRASALILVPYTGFSDVELGQLRSYVSSGGTLVLLDDYGFGNQVLSGLGLKMRFMGYTLMDPLFNHKNALMPKITNFANQSFSVNVTSVVFNHATALNGTSDASVIAVSSSFSFVDVNGDGEFDAGDVAGPMPVAAFVRVGEGFVVAVTDPSLLINGMVGFDDNLLFIRDVAGLRGGDVVVFVAQNHLPSAPLDDAKAALAVVYGVVASPVGTVSLIVIALAISLKSLLNRRDGNGKSR